MDSTKKGDILLTIVVLTGMIMLGGLLVLFQMQNLDISQGEESTNISRRLVGSYPVHPLGKHQAYFQIGSHKSSLAKDELVQVEIKLVTSGEQFDLAGVQVRWDQNTLQYISSQPADLTGDELAQTKEISSNQRLSMMYVPHAMSDQNMTTIANQPELFYTLTFKAKIDQPETVISIVPDSKNTSLHFINTTGNAVSQLWGDPDGNYCFFAPKASRSAKLN